MTAALHIEYKKHIHKESLSDIDFSKHQTYTYDGQKYSIFDEDFHQMTPLARELAETQAAVSRDRLSEVLPDRDHGWRRPDYVLFSRLPRSIDSFLLINDAKWLPSEQDRFTGLVRFKEGSDVPACLLEVNLSLPCIALNSGAQ